MNGLPYVQVGVNIGFSVVQLGHLFYYFPFEDYHIMISTLSGEITTAAFISMSAIYIGCISAMIYTIIGSIGIQFIVSIYSLTLSLKIMWRKLLKCRASGVFKEANSSSLMILP